MEFDITTLPEQLQSRESMDIDGSIILHEGAFTLKSDSISVDLFGSIMFKWFPGHGVSFEGRGTAPWNIHEVENFDLLVGGTMWGGCFLTNIDQESFRGVLNAECVVGERAVPVTCIEFEVCNLREFNGKMVRVGPARFSNNLLVFEDDSYIIKLFKHVEFRSKYKELKWNGNYQTLYSGILSNKGKNNLTYRGTIDLFVSLSLFLSFLNGRRSSAIFRKGVFENRAVWSDYSPYHVDKYKSVLSWTPQAQTTEIENIWPVFYKLQCDENSKDVLDVAIFTYLRANGNIAHSFEGVPMIANTLELLFNYLIVETKKMISGKDVENLQASNKIRLLLSLVGIKNAIPTDLLEIRNFQTPPNAFSQMDGPELFTQIRNSIVHGQLEKRRSLSKIPDLVVWEVLQMGIWYVEVILLYILEYKGTYRNRVLNAKWAGQGEEAMPYLQNK